MSTETTGTSPWTEVLRRGADLLDSGGVRWVQREWGSVQEGKACLRGLVRTCSPVPGDGHLVDQVMVRRGWDDRWNDDDNRTRGDVLTVLRGEEVADDDLAETFGPSWRLVAAVVRAAAGLTGEQAEQVVAAKAAAGDAARDAAKAAAGDAAEDAAWDAAGDAARAAAKAAARAAARAAAWAAAGDAARASVTVDLPGVTDEQWHLLWQPLASVCPDLPQTRADALDVAGLTMQEETP